MATLAQLRAKLNGEIGVATDGDTVPWSTTVRNNAIIEGYADLWARGVWKPATQALTSADDQGIYALTAIRRLYRIELVDSSSRITELPLGTIEDNWTGGYQLRLRWPLVTGSTIRVLGWTAYKSQFAGEADTDDIPAEWNRVPLLKAQAILYRIAMGEFTRYGERQALPPSMSVSIEGFLAVIASKEREYLEAAAALSRLRPRAGQIRKL